MTEIMSIEEFAEKRYCLCGEELEPFNLTLCNECIIKELVFRSQVFKRMVRKKFGYKCFYCGISERKCLTIHHLEPSNPNRFDINTVVLSCYNCHALLNEGSITRALSNGKELVI